MKLIFIYNAYSGRLNSLIDIGHKLLSPSTYKCSLCAFTHDTFSESIKWKNFREESGITMEFFHKDEFEEKFKISHLSYPSIIKYENDHFSTVLDKQLLDNIKNVEELIERLNITL